MGGDVPSLDKSAIVRVLREISTLLEIAGANPFEVMAFQNGAESLDGWQGDVGAAVDDGTLTKIPGIGKGLSRVIGELVTTGKSQDHQELRDRFPPGLPAVLKVPGIGPKKIKVLYEQLEIGSLEDLEEAANGQRIRGLKGFGAKTEETILSGIPVARKRLERDREQSGL
jgi:DNA polymerase (family 10)